MLSNFCSYPFGNMRPAIQRKYNDHCCCLCSVDAGLHCCQIQKNLFNRKGFSAKKLNYNIIYTNGVEISTRDSSYNKIIVENEDIKKIALDVKERCPSARGAFIDYFSEGNYAIIGLTLEETYGSQLGEYFYYDNTYIQSINTHGSLESITYYK